MKQLRDNEWVTPHATNFIHECCDCGLRHEMDFRIVRMGPRRNGKFKARPIYAPEHAIQFRARRIKKA